MTKGLSCNKQTEKIILIEKEIDFMKNIIDSIPYPLYVINLDYTISLANNAAKEKGIIKRKHCYKATHNSKQPCKNEHVCPLQKVVETKKIVRVEHTHYNEKGEVRYVEVLGAPIFDREGNVVQIIEASFDVTVRKKAEKVLEEYQNRLKAEIKQRTDELEKIHRAFEDRKRLADIGVLAATLAHEMRNPLAGIKLAAFNIKQKNVNEALDKHLYSIDQTIGDCEKIIRNFLSYSKVKKPNYQKVRIVELLETIAENMKEKYAKWDVELVQAVNCKKEQVIECDFIQIKELFWNILDNAYQSFSKRKGLIEIKISYNKQSSQIIAEFKNNGKLIAKKDLENIFKPFYTTKTRGIGLGLTLCKQVVELHKGTIDIESKKKTGTIVKIILPKNKLNIQEA